MANPNEKPKAIRAKVSILSLDGGETWLVERVYYIVDRYRGNYLDGVRVDDAVLRRLTPEEAEARHGR